MWDKLSVLAGSRVWWLLLLVLSLAMNAVALVYQYGFDEWPCVLCIHVRILFLLMMLISVLAMLLMRWRLLLVFFHVATIGVFAAMLNRAWLLLATERGWIEGECSLNLGMPDWLALDQWMPEVFAAMTSCGYTPVIIARITMAEILTALSVVLLITNTVLLLALLMRRENRSGI